MKKPKLEKVSVVIPQVDRACQVKGRVHSEGDVVYSVVLNQTDIAKNNNKYYKIQVVQSDGGQFHVFRSWGRVGYDGQTSLNAFPTSEAAMKDFAKVYREKTKNVWNSQEPFVKVAGKYHVIEMDVATENKAVKVAQSLIVSSKLHPQVQTLMKMLFDVDSMKQTMKDFNLDPVKLPLGRISKKQMMDAYVVLTDLSNLITRGVQTEEKFVDASNRFYTLMPHNFGMTRAPVINTRQMVEEKRDMLDNMIQIEVAYNMMKPEDGVAGKMEVNPLDAQYEKMKIKMEPMDRGSDDFELIKRYVENTHASTHSGYSLELEDVFKVEREGEKAQYKKYAKLHNRQLLWHGSRKTNFVGILSNGLKIAPKEAPVTGYMFGKGIYFADMVSKSANYCCTNRNDPVGLLLLSEVALGTTHDLTAATYMEKAPKGKHSTKGIGETRPDPKGAHTRKDGSIIPMGKPITDKSIPTSLLYNEYIVYETAQVNLQYLLKVKFVYKR